MKSKIMEVISAVPAAGKTKAILSSIRNADRTLKPTIVASITKELSHQSFQYFMDHMFDARIDLYDDVAIVDSDNNSSKHTVQQSIQSCVNSNTKLIFITHAALLQMANEVLAQCSVYDLFIDETPTLVDFKQYSLTIENFNDVLLRRCELVESDQSKLKLLKVKAGCESNIKEAIKHAELENDDIYTLLRPIYECLIRNQIVLVNNDESKPLVKIYVLDDLGSTDQWDIFKSITIAAANFKDSFDKYILQSRGWKFKDSKLNDKLEFNRYSNTGRVKIHVLIDGFWSKSVSTKTVIHDGKKIKLFDAMVKKINTKLKRSKSACIYTTNSYRSAAIYRGESVKYNPHGLNSYMSHTAAAVLFSYNPFPWQVPVMKAYAEFSSLNPAEFVRAYRVSKYLEPAFQLCARTNIRDNESKRSIDLFVPDMELAEYIKHNYFTDAVIVQDETEEIVIVKPKVKSKPKARQIKSFQSMLKMTDVERTKFAYISRKYTKDTGSKLNVDNEIHMEFVKEWLSRFRSKSVWS